MIPKERLSEIDAVDPWTIVAGELPGMRIMGT